LERWNAGCHTAIQLFQELQACGYPGSYRRVTASVSRIRQAQGIPPRRQGRRQRLPVVAEPVAQLHAQSAEVAEAIDLAQDFAHLVRERQPARLDAWLTRATASTLEALQRFASGLQEDYKAVKAGVTLPWSTSPVAGHINRLKMLKRQMVGRAHLDLLSRRFLRAPRGDRAQADSPPAPAQVHAGQDSRVRRYRHGGHEGWRPTGVARHARWGNRSIEAITVTLRRASPWIDEAPQLN